MLMDSVTGLILRSDISVRSSLRGFLPLSPPSRNTYGTAKQDIVQ